jgi:hypothetical protein
MNCSTSFARPWVASHSFEDLGYITPPYKPCGNAQIPGIAVLQLAQ